MMGLISLTSLLRHIGLQAVFVLTVGWSAAASAQGSIAGGIGGVVGPVPPNPTPLVPQNHPINLLAPLDDSTMSITTTNGQPFEAFKQYFAIAWPWLIGIAAGIAVLWAIVGGIEIMLSGSDTGLRDRGKSRFLNALLGLLLIGLSGMILQILNPIGFTQ